MVITERVKDTHVQNRTYYRLRMLWTAESHLHPSRLAATVTADRIVYVLTIARLMIPWFARRTRRRSHSHNLKEIETTFHSL